jgi:hypothetical protein
VFPYCRDRLPSAEEDYNYHESAYLDPPAPRAISPPGMRGARPGSGDSGTGDHDGAYDSDGDSVGGGGSGAGNVRGGHSMASVAPSDAPYSAASGATGGSKKAKKGSSKKASSDMGKNYGGLEEALQLPKIGASSTACRRK